MNERQYQNAAGQNVFIMALALVVVFGGLVWSLGYALDQHFQDQDVMLCNSAKVSGNDEWLVNCGRYYQTHNPKDILEPR